MSEVELNAEQTQLVENLVELHDKVAKLEEEFEKEVLQLELKYADLKAPIFKERRTLLLKDKEEDTEGTPGLPSFWLKAMKAHPALHFEPEDEKILAHLRDIEVNRAEGGHSFDLVFHFTPNEWFSNSTITKSYELSMEGRNEILEEIRCTDIDWKEGKNVCVEIVKQSQKNKRTNATRVVEVTRKTKSFFNFFASHKLPTPEEIPSLKLEEAQEIGRSIEEDYQRARIIRDRIVEAAVTWFNGEGEDSDLESVLDDDADESDFDISDSELEAMGALAGAKGKKKPECEQQ